MIIYYYDV